MLYIISSHSLANIVALVLLRERRHSDKLLVIILKITKIPLVNTTIVIRTSIRVIDFNNL